MIKIEFIGETSSEVIVQIQEFIKANNEVSTAVKKPLKKVADDEEDDEQAPVKKKVPVKKVAEEEDDEQAPVKKKAAAGKPGEIDDAALRATLTGTDWPIDQARAFINKFGYESIAIVPQKRRQELLDLVEEASSWSAKKLSAYLEDDDL